MARKHSKSCTVGVQKYICIVDCASGLSRRRVVTFVFKQEIVCTDALVLSKTEVLVHLSHSSLDPELSQFIVLKLI